MELMRCSRCGAPIPNVEDEKQKIIKCEYCDYDNIRPKHHKDNRYNVATKLRQEAEFDQAIVEYEKLLAEDETDDTAHWGLLLCKYGIEYVEDPATGETVPTCHLDRLQEEPVQKEAHYIAAMEYADEYIIKEKYEQEARQIDEVRADIMAATKNQAPYDVFICYKSKDEWKHRTEDSVWAQDIYEELTKRNYRVFFADKTIELGMKYEPVIFHALYSAPIMIVVGTKEEYLNSIWVRNEWSRYLKLIKNSDKTIFLAFKDMDPNCFPGELKPWQAQDLAQIGAMQDLISAVEKKLKTVGVSQSVSMPVVEGISVNQCPRLLKNGETFLSLDNFEEAETVYKTITKDYPEEYRGWWGLIVCKTKNFQKYTEKKFSKDEILGEQIDLWYRYVKRLAPPQEFIELEEIYLKYAELMAWRDTHSYIKSKNINIDTYKGGISREQNRIKESEAKSLEYLNSRNYALNDLNTKEEEWEDISQQLESKIKKQERAANWIFVWVVLLILGPIIAALIAFESGGFLFLLGIVGLVIDIVYLCSTEGVSSLKSQHTEAQNTIAKIQSNRQQLQKKYESDRIECGREIAEMKKNIAQFQADIWEEQALLERGEQAIHQEIYEDLCRKIKEV